MSAKRISLYTDQSLLSITSKVRIKNWTGGRGTPRHVFEEGECREEILWGIRNNFQTLVSSENRVTGGNSWDRERVQNADIVLDDLPLKQGGQTTLMISTDHYNDYGDNIMCTRPCCADIIPKIMDTLVGNLGLLLDPDPHYGDWWQSPTQKKNNSEGIEYYGINNSCLQHPALLHIVLGMFRQAHLLFTTGQEKGLLEAVPYSDTKKALNNADWKQAWKNLEAARHWIEVAAPMGTYVFWPFPAGYWSRLKALHTALYKYGVDEVFEADSVAERWGIEKRSFDLYDPPESSVHGAWGYFGSNDKPTTSGKRLLKLGK
jgi:hypothetical protein